MADSNGTVKWWQAVTISVSLLGTTIGLFTWGASHVIANDRLRERGDIELRQELNSIFLVISNKLDLNTQDHSIIKQDLAVMKTKLGIIND